MTVTHRLLGVGLYTHSLYAELTYYYNKLACFGAVFGERKAVSAF